MSWSVIRQLRCLARQTAMNVDDKAINFVCQSDWLYGVASLPEHAIECGVLIVVGGPQYRAGSHRQFTLLARYLASHGIPVMRFDYRGMGDSQGTARTFEDIDQDLRAAVDQFMSAAPGLKEVVIWGLCDAASAAILYAHQDQRVTGLILVNPWIRTEQGVAKAYLKHYYLRRAFAAEFWRKIIRGGFDYAVAARSFTTLVGQVFGVPHPTSAGNPDAHALPERLYQSLSLFKGKILLVLSGNDLTAQEFTDLISSSRQWRKLLDSRQTSRHDLPGANHTFSTREWRDQVASWTKDWMLSR